MKTGITIARPGEKLFQAAMRQDPYACYQQLRDEDPLHWDDTLKLWAVTRYEDVTTVLNDKRFSSRRVERARKRFPQAEFQPLFETLSIRMSERDEPDHRRLRALVHDAFIRTAVEQWQPRVQDRLDSLLDNISGSRFDLISQVAIPLPLGVILEMVGIPEEDQQQVRAWCDDFSIVALNLYAAITEEELRRGQESVAAFREYLQQRVTLAEKSPGQDLLSSLVQVQHEGTKLSLDELLANLLLLLAAGNETTTCVIGNGMAALLQHPDQLARLRQDPTLTAGAVEECLRYDSPVQFLGRVAEEEIVMHGNTIHKDQIVLAFLGSANRDSAKFPDADSFQIDRAHSHHVAFGHGQHFCAGSQLARLESRLAIESLLARFPNLRLDPECDLVYRENFNIRCLNELWLQV